MSNRRVLCSLVILTLGLLCPSWASAQHYTQTNLVSDTGSTPVTDSNLKNAWGLVHSPTSPWWISDNATGLSTLYNTSTTPATSRAPIHERADNTLLPSEARRAKEQNACLGG